MWHREFRIPSRSSIKRVIEIFGAELETCVFGGNYAVRSDRGLH